MQPSTNAGHGTRASLRLNQLAEAAELLTNDPLALLIGMVLDQPMPQGWSGLAR
ncbi:hypothetical protein [Frankia sp. Cas3]|uniref:hypothetical protein n=1 Tax=Frankia sp. Cas3 TaxID=3073926 RepID=UPI002AD43082|nr:hypothetical protein [Frankia sp. Cas3]